MAGYAGWQGSRRLACMHERRLRERFPENFLKALLADEPAAWHGPWPAAGDGPEEEIQGEDGGDRQGLTDFMAARILETAGGQILTFHPAGKGGIFSDIWDLADAAGLGVRIFLDRILIRQETVEICDYLDVNPYLLGSEDTCLFVSQTPMYTASGLRRAGIPAESIGFFTGDRKRLILYDGKERFLTPWRGQDM